MQQQDGISSWLKTKPPVLNDYWLNESSATIKMPNAYVVIGASTGGTKAIETIIKKLNPGLNAAILIAVHLPEKFTKTFTNGSKDLQL